MRKIDLFNSVSHYCLGLNHYKLARERKSMDQMIEEAEANQYGKC